MRLSTEQILTSHVGRLPPPQNVVDVLVKRDGGGNYDREKFEEVMADAVENAVRRQLEAGIDIPSDGEMSKISYATYFRQRLDGLEQNPRGMIPRDIEDLPEYHTWWIASALCKMRRTDQEFFPRISFVPSSNEPRSPRTGPVTVKDLEPLAKDIAHLKKALSKRNVIEGFMNSVSPGAIAAFQANEYYSSYRAFLEAIAEAMRQEYELIVNSGLLLQIDCPDLAMGRHTRQRQLSDAQFVEHAELCIAVLNQALANIPPDRVRLHVCWGYYEASHVYDIDFRKILPIVLKGKAMALSIEGANPRHEHQWEVWQEFRLPDDKVLIPGVIAASIDCVEHPELVAQRILRYASIVGRERIIAGSDCGFGTFAGYRIVHPDTAWMKLRSLTEGARLASKQLWGGRSQRVPNA